MAGSNLSILGAHSVQVVHISSGIEIDLFFIETNSDAHRFGSSHWGPPWT